LPGARTGSAASGSALQVKQENNWKGEPVSKGGLVAESSAHGDALAASGTAAAQHGSAGLGLHARPEPVCLHTVAAIGLKCALRHEDALLFPLENLNFDSTFEYIAS